MKYIKTPFVDAYTKSETIRNGRVNPYEDSMDIHWIVNKGSGSCIYGTVPDNTKIKFGQELSEDEFKNEVKDVIQSSGKYKSLENDISLVEDSDKKSEFESELSNIEHQEDFQNLSSKVKKELPEEDESE